MTAREYSGSTMATMIDVVFTRFMKIGNFSVTPVTEREAPPPFG
jgi:hypothetical protein